MLNATIADESISDLSPISDKTFITFNTQKFEDLETEITAKTIDQFLHKEIMNLMSINDGNKMINLRNNTLLKYINNMFSNHSTILSTRADTIKELFILHHTSKGFYLYNDRYLGLSYQEVRSRLLFPNLIYLMHKYLPKAHRFLRNCLNAVYNENKSKNYGIIKRHVESYYADEDVIKNDILYQFLGDGLKKFDPLFINKPDAFYKQSFRQLFYYYFKSEEKAHTSYSTIWDTDISISTMMSTTSRLSTYRDVMYELQVEKYCKESFALQQIHYNYGIFKNVIIPNELQNMYFNSKTDNYALNCTQYKLLKIYDSDRKQEKSIKRIKKELPIIYQLLKCVHIINPKSRPYNEMMIKPELVKTAVLEELVHPFRNFFGEDHLMAVLDRVAANFTNNILSGEYVNLMNINSIRINQPSFIKQVRLFIRICIEETLL